MTVRIPASESLDGLLVRVRDCTICDGLPLGPLPILRAGAGAKVLVVGQAPGRKTHAKGRPFDDVSGERLREWLVEHNQKGLDDISMHAQMLRRKAEQERLERQQQVRYSLMRVKF